MFCHIFFYFLWFIGFKVMLNSQLCSPIWNKFCLISIFPLVYWVQNKVYFVYFLLNGVVIWNIWIVTHHTLLRFTEVILVWWVTEENWIHWVHKKKKNNAICVGHHCTQANTNNVNKTWVHLQTTRSKDEPFLCGNRNVHHNTKLKT